MSDFHYTSRLKFKKKINLLFFWSRKFGSMSLNGSQLSIDQQHTCPMTNVMVCSGLNHKNCQSWSRLVNFLNNPSWYKSNYRQFDGFFGSFQPLRTRQSVVTKWSILWELCRRNATTITVHNWTWNNRLKLINNTPLTKFKWMDFKESLHRSYC